MDLVNTALSFIFSPDKKRLREETIDLLMKHRIVDGMSYDIINLGLRYQDAIWSHPDRPKQVRGMTALKVVNVLPEYEQEAAALNEVYKLLEKDSRRASKTLNQLVRGMQTDQDLRDSFPEFLAEELGLTHLPRTRKPAFRYENMEPRVYANILKDLEMIEGYYNARILL